MKKKSITFNKWEIENALIPLIKKYNLRFLTFNRTRQYALVNYIIDNKLKYWKDIPVWRLRPYSIRGGLWEGNELEILKYSPEIIELDVRDTWIKDWIVGFTIAEGKGSFLLSKREKRKGGVGPGFSINQTGIENYEILRAIKWIIVGREGHANLTVNRSNSYELKLTSIKYFTSSNVHPIIGYKKEQFDTFVKKLKEIWEE